MGDDGCVAICVRKLNRLQRFGQRPDLVHLQEDRVADALVDAPLQPRRIRNEDVVSDELHAVAELYGQFGPRPPLVLGQGILERDDRVGIDEPAEELDHLFGSERAALEPVRAVAPHLGRRRVERDRNTFPPTGPVSGLEHHLDRPFAGVEIGRETALIADPRREAALVQDRAERLKDLGADLHRLGEAFGSGGNEHELLQVDRVLSVRAAVDHVQHRHRQRVGFLAAEVAEERNAGLCRRGLRRRKRDAEDRVRAEPALVRRAVELDQRAVDPGLVEGIAAADGLGDLTVDIRNGLRDSLAAIGLAAVAKLDRFVHSGRRPRRDRGAAESPGIESNIDLDCRIAARVEDLARVNAGDRAHLSVSFARSK